MQNPEIKENNTKQQQQQWYTQQYVPSCYSIYNENAIESGKGSAAFTPGFALWKQSDFIDGSFTLKYHFMQKDQQKMKHVKDGFNIWKSVGMKLNFQQTDKIEQAYIRIKFDDQKQNSSFVGKDSIQKPQSYKQQTMNLNFPTVYNPGYMSIILHEIGHAIGLQHQHQNPFTDIEFDHDQIYQFFRGKPKDQILKNILNRGFKAQESFGISFDRLSIMGYNIPGTCFKKPQQLKQKGSIPKIFDDKQSKIRRKQKKQILQNKDMLTDKDICFVKCIYPDPDQFFTPQQPDRQLQKKCKSFASSLIIYFQNPTAHYYELQSAFKPMTAYTVQKAPKKVIKYNSTSTMCFTNTDQLIQLKGQIKYICGICEDILTITFNIPKPSSKSFILSSHDSVGSSLLWQQGKKIEVDIISVSSKKGFHMAKIKFQGDLERNEEKVQNIVTRINVKCAKQVKYPKHNFLLKGEVEQGQQNQQQDD